MKGRAAPVMTYEVMGMKGEPMLESSRLKVAQAELGGDMGESG